MMMIDVANVAVTAKEFPLPHWWTIVSVVVTSMVGVLSLSAAVEGYFKTHIATWLRLPLAAGGLMMIVPELTTDLIGMAIVAAVLMLNLRQARNTAATAG